MQRRKNETGAALTFPLGLLGKEGKAFHTILKRGGE